MSITRRPAGTAAFGVALLVAAAALLVVGLRGPSHPGALDERVRAVASTLRCPVCQNLSVADSPARLAQQMRATIARDLEAGRTPDQIRGRFAAAYGDWILLAPPKRGIDLIAWLGPVLLVAGGVAVAALSIRRWTSGRTATVGRDAVATEVAPGLTAADQRLLARALEASVEERE